MRSLVLFVAMVALAPAVQAQPAFSKAFSPDVIGPGSVSTLTFTVDASGVSASTPVTDLAFTDVLPAGVSVATPAAASTTCADGRALASLSAPEGGGTITFSGGVVAGGSVCTVTVNVTASVPSTYTNISGDLTSSEGNSGTASDDLTVSTDRPGFSKSFSPATVPFQGRSRLTFTIDNSANAGQVFNMNFSDDLPSGMTIADPSNAVSTCPSGLAPLDATPGASRIAYADFTNQALASGATCTISVDVIGGSVGSLDNVTSDLTTTSASTFQSLSSGRAGARLTVVTGALALTASFTDDPTPPGGTVGLQFTLRNLNRTESVTNLSFTEDLDAALPGLAAVDLPQSDVCGAGSQLTQASGVLTLTGGVLAPEGTCTFGATLQIPAGAAPGTYTISTSAVTGDAGSRPVVGLEASDDLIVSSVPLLTQSFINDPASPGASVTLRFGITNTSATSGATDLAFTDPLPFLAISDAGRLTLPPNGFCGPGSTIFPQQAPSSGPLQLAVTGANLPASGSCTFDVGIELPDTLPGGSYAVVSSRITGTVGGASVSGAPAADDLAVIETPVLTKSFPDSPARPGTSTPLQFTLRYGEEAPAGATAIAFTDDLGAALPGLVATGLPVSACGGTLSSADGGSTLAYSGGALTAGEECTFRVDVSVPAGAATGTYTNTTGPVTAQVGGSAVTGASASGDLFVSPVLFSKAFDGPVLPGGTVTLAFTIENASASAAQANLFFTDNLGSMLSGLASTSGTLNDVCGSGSSITGTTFLIFTGGTLNPGASCTFDVTLAVPAGAAPNTYTNVTSTLNGSGGAVAQPAIARLVVTDPAAIVPAFSKAFSPEAIEIDESSTLTFTIDNAASGAAATALAFTDNFPAGLVVAATPAASTTCTGGTLTAVAGAGTVSLSGASVPAAASCTVRVDVTSAAEGVYDNTSGALSSSAGTSGTASATLTVTRPNLLLTGQQAYRALALPTGSAYDQLLAPLWTQGFDGSDRPSGGCSAYTYDETAASFEGGYMCLTDQDATWPRGTGVYVFVYEDDNLDVTGIQGGFPKSITVPSRDLPNAGAPFTYPGSVLSYTNNPGVPSYQEGWNLLGNPLTAGMDWDETVRGGGLTPTIYVLDPNYFGGDYRTWTADIGGDLPGGVVPAFQGFFAKAVAGSPTLTAPVASVVEPSPDVYGKGASGAEKAADEPAPLRFELSLDGSAVSATFVAVSPEASLGEDVLDAIRLAPVAWPRTVLSTRGVGSDVPLALNALPQTDGEIEIPLEIAAEGHGAGPLSLRLGWTGALPEGWTATLLDRQRQTSLALNDGGEYAFEVIVPEGASGLRPAGLGLLGPTPDTQVFGGESAAGDAVSTGSRFALRLTPGFATSGAPEPTPTTLALLAPSPNPARGAVTLGYAVPLAADVSLAVYDALGRDVAVLARGPHAAGRHEARLDLNGLAPGVYVARLVAGDAVSVQRFTVVR
ncbi:T9SS type A sorting domain-containing protein [Rubricoccus marinus]|nr:T9SS type A sorting domain-containing protein [Rubricoccus marinus]